MLNIVFSIEISINKKEWHAATKPLYFLFEEDELRFVWKTA
jgi:hypothetical protein